MTKKKNTGLKKCLYKTKLKAVRKILSAQNRFLRQKALLSIMMKGVIHQEEIIILPLYFQITSKYIKQDLHTKIKWIMYR